jgi:Histidine kinase-, DNA gyrase B-, and HSP90-like ATPase
MKFTVSPRILDHFGIAMYNTVQKAIAELCANSYDADAHNVWVTYETGSILIRDDGTGMTPDQVQNFYLRLGRDKRTASDGVGKSQVSQGGRPVIGNKGIGKLAGFGIAETIVLTTWREGVRTSVTLNRSDFENSLDLQSVSLQSTTEYIDDQSTGTQIQLTNLFPETKNISLDKLRAYLARHLPSRAGWAVFVNDAECKPSDIPGARHLISDTIEDFGKVKGFYIVATDRRSLEPGFAIRIRDRVVQDSSLFGLNQQTHGYFNLVRIVGELEPDFIDPIDSEVGETDRFIINTSRDGFNPEDPAVIALNKYARDKLGTIAAGLAAQKTTQKKKEALQRNPEFETRLKALGPEIYAKLDASLDALIAKLSKNEDDATVDEVIDLIIRYYESDALRLILESIKDAAPTEVERLSGLLGRYGAAQIGEVADLLATQLEVIDLLRVKVKDGALEKEIHAIVAQNIWLLRDDLTYWFDNKTFATQLGDLMAKKFSFAASKRPDLVYYDDRTLQATFGTAPKRIHIVEFKRPGVTISASELLQVMQYKQILGTAFPQTASADLAVTIIGDKFDDSFDRSAFQENYVFLSYEELLTNAHHRYHDLYVRLRPEMVSAESV